MQRWSMPFGEVEWPNRVAIIDKTAVKRTTIDQRVDFSAEITKGLENQMRVVMRYQVFDENKKLVSETLSINLSQNKGENKLFETQVGFYDYFSAEQNDGVDQSGYVKYWFESGDGVTDITEINLVLRPAVIGCDVVITPPAYAALLGQTKLEINLNSGTLSTIKALEGSSVEIQWKLNKSVLIDGDDAEILLPGLDVSLVDNGAEIEYQNNVLRLTMIASQSVASQVKLLDNLGFENLSERVYRIEVVKDKHPTVKMTQPKRAIDVSPLAVVPLEAVSQDDVAVNVISLKSVTQKPVIKGGKTVVETKVYDIHEVVGQSAILSIDNELDLALYDLKHGDSVKIYATALDGFKIGARTHGAVESKPLTLNIVDATKIVEEIMKDLGHIRKNVESITTDQKRLLEDKKISEIIKKQKQISRRIDNQLKQVRAIEKQAEMNKISDKNVKALISQIKKNLEKAKLKSNEAEKQAEQTKKSADKKRSNQAESKNKKSDEKANKEADKKENKNKENNKKDKSDSKKKPSGDENEKQKQKQDKAPNSEKSPQSDDQKDELKKKQNDVVKPLEEILQLLDHNNSIMQIKVKLVELKTKQKETVLEGMKLYPMIIGQSFGLLSDINRAAVESLATQQTNHFNQANDIIQLIQNTVTGLENQSSKAKDRATADMLTRVIRIALEDGLIQNTYSASQKILKNNISEAQTDQKLAMLVIDQMLKELNDHEKLKKEILKLTLRELNEDLQKLIKTQKKEISKLDREKEFFNNLVETMRRLYKKSFATQAKADKIEETKPIGVIVKNAMGEMIKAISSLKLKNKPNATLSENASLVFLENALVENKKLEAKNKGDEQDKKREKTRRKYLVLAKKELDLKIESEKIFGIGKKLTRLQKRKLSKFSTKQKEITEAISLLKNELEKSEIFLSVHDEIDELSLSIVDSLSKQELDTEVIENEQDIIELLLMIAEALEKIKPKDEMGEGGGGGGGSGKPPLIGPVKEMKLLRAKQLRVLRKTKQLDNNTNDVSSNNYKRKVNKIGKMQDQVVDQAEKVSKKIPKQ